MGPRRDDYMSRPAHAPVGQLPPTPPDTEDNDSDITDEVGFPLPPPSKVPEVLELDKKTPDAHVPRDARLIRLTGVHPFNVEPPLLDLYNSGASVAAPGSTLLKNPKLNPSRIPDAA